MNKPKGGAMSKQEGDGATWFYGAKSKNEGKVVNKQKKTIDLCIFIKLQITLKEFLSYATTT
jgi:hypothetical protein